MADRSKAAKKAVKTIKLRYGNDYFVKLAGKGGRAAQKRWFDDPDNAKKAINKRWEKK